MTGTLERTGSRRTRFAQWLKATPFVQWLPTSTLDRRVRVFAWLSLATQTMIVGTGGLVRLTGSGLGCPTWPRCTADSFVNTPEMGIHGVIEFGNRLLTFVLIAIAIVAFLMIVRMRRERPDLFALALILGLGIPGQGIIGGITVLTNLNPYIVGLHFVLSVVLVCLATTFVYRVYRGGGPRGLVVPDWFARTAHLLAAAVGLTIIAGILTTGSGPHAGDHGAARNGLDPELLQHIHSWPAYVAFGLTVALVAVSFIARIEGPRRFLVLLLATEMVQIAVGLIQANLGLPPFLVGAHMVLACVLASFMTASLLSLKR